MGWRKRRSWTTKVDIRPHNGSLETVFPLAVVLAVAGMFLAQAIWVL